MSADNTDTKLERFYHLREKRGNLTATYKEEIELIDLYMWAIQNNIKVDFPDEYKKTSNEERLDKLLALADKCIEEMKKPKKD